VLVNGAAGFLPRHCGAVANVLVVLTFASLVGGCVVRPYTVALKNALGALMDALAFAGTLTIAVAVQAGATRDTALARAGTRAVLAGMYLAVLSSFISVARFAVMRWMRFVMQRTDRAAGAHMRLLLDAADNRPSANLVTIVDDDDDDGEGDAGDDAIVLVYEAPTAVAVAAAAAVPAAVPAASLADEIDALLDTDSDAFSFDDGPLGGSGADAEVDAALLAQPSDDPLTDDGDDDDSLLGAAPAAAAVVRTMEGIRIKAELEAALAMTTADIIAGRRVTAAAPTAFDDI
jgi:hypothetical protein